MAVDTLVGANESGRGSERGGARKKGCAQEKSRKQTGCAVWSISATHYPNALPSPSAVSGGKRFLDTIRALRTRHRDTRESALLPELLGQAGRVQVAPGRQPAFR